MKKDKIVTIANMKNKHEILSGIIAFIVVLICILPMELSPYWNGKIPEHRNQYELLADAILEGHLDIRYDNIDKRLYEMENPYDTMKRYEENISVPWDHAYYNKKFYMYFGVAPVFLTFIPFKLITGQTLLSHNATQIFAAFFIFGIFTLFYLICKLFYKETPLSVYLTCSSAFSILSIWVSICQPALYCTAIVSGLCMAVWCLYFFMSAVYDEHSENKRIVLAAIGSLFGALTFACRPPIGFANFLIIPMFIHYLKQRKADSKLVKKLILAALPYLVIACLLMIYNYARFENPFEFGQSYQLTIEDQTAYKNIFSRIDYAKIINGIHKNFFENGSTVDIFPYTGIKGILLNFPILFLPLLIINDKFRKNLKEKKLFSIYTILMILPVVVTIVDVIYAPSVDERYRMDEYYLMSILTFITIVNWYQVSSSKKFIRYFINIFAMLTILKCALLFCVPFDVNYAYVYPDQLKEIVKKITFGLAKT